MTRHLGAGLHRGQVSSAISGLDYICGCSLLMPAALLRNVGLPEESFFLYGEDLDWGLRIRAAGRSLEAAVNSVVWHKGGATTGSKSPRQDYYVVRSGLQVVRKHFPWMLPSALACTLLRSLMPKIFRLQGSRLLAVLHGMWDGMLGRYGPSPKYESQRAQP
jgi:hypothetical protein